MPIRQRLIRILKLTTFAIVVIVIAFACVLPVGLAYFYIDNYVHWECGNRPEPLTERMSNPESLETFTFTPADGVTLDAWYATGTNGAGIIILPGASGGHNTMYQEMEFLHQAGYSVMTYDTRSCADPPQITTLGYAEIADLKIALDIMSVRPDIDPQRIGVFGHSMGGATAIMTAAQDDRIKAVAVSGNYHDLADNIRRDNGRSPNLLERWTRYWLVFFYEHETGVNVDDARPIAVIGDISPRAVFLIHGSEELEDSHGLEQFEAAGEPKELWIVEGAGHGGYAHTDFENYRSHIIDFFDRYLLSQDATQ